MDLLKTEIVSSETAKREEKHNSSGRNSRLLRVQPGASDNVVKGAESSICSFQPEPIE